MRADPDFFVRRNSELSREPRHIIEISFDEANANLWYFTSHDDIVLHGGASSVSRCVQKLAVTSQDLKAETATATIGAINFDLVDRGSAVTNALAGQLALGRSTRRQRVRVFYGFKGFAWADPASVLGLQPEYRIIQTQLVTLIEYKDGAYHFTCADIQRELRTTIFNQAKTTLAQPIGLTDLVINVYDTSAFETVAHGSSYSDSTGLIVGYIKIEDEVIAWTSKTSTTFTAPASGRGALNTRAVAHDVDANATQDRRTPVEEYVHLELPLPKMAYALLTGRLLATENLLLRSQEFDNAAWSKTNVTVTANLVTAPDGTVTMDKLAATASAATKLSEITGAIGSSSVVHSIYIRKGSGATDANKYGVRNNTTATDLLIVSVDFDSQAITYLTGTSGASVVPQSDGSLRLFLSVASGITVGGSLEIFTAFKGDAETAGEYSYAWGANLSLGTEQLPYALTTTVARAGDVLPEGWHLGVPSSYVHLDDFVGIGSDLYNPFDDEASFVGRGEDFGKLDGKKFLEAEVALLAGCFMPIYTDGAIGFRRMSRILAGAPDSGTLDETNVVSWGALQHDYDSVHNVFEISWNWEPLRNDFSRKTDLIDIGSAAIYKGAPVLRLAFRLLHGSRHSAAMISQRFDALRDRFTGPPQRLTLNGLHRLNAIEVGDVRRVRLQDVRDFAAVGGGGPIDRAFEVQNISVDWVTGALSLKLFASSRAPGPLAPTTDTSVLTHAWYISEGVALSSVLTITGSGPGHISANGNLAGDDAMISTGTGAIYYYSGDLQLDAGKVVTVNKNVWLRIEGNFQINGTIDGVGRGYAGAPATVATVFTGFIHNVGRVGFIGSTLAGGGILVYAGFQSIAQAAIPGQNSAVPEFNLGWDGTTLSGMPQDLRGTSGSSGLQVFFGPTFAGAVQGGAGGAGGAGLAITSRGISFGASGKIDLSGADGARGQSIIAVNKFTAGGGAGGASGALLITIDGFGNTATGLDQVVAHNGVTPIGGEPLPAPLVGDTGPDVSSFYYGSGDGVWNGAPLNGAQPGGNLAYQHVQYVPGNPAATVDPIFKTIDMTIEEVLVSNWSKKSNPKAFQLFGVVWFNAVRKYFAVGAPDGTNAYIVQGDAAGNVWLEENPNKNIQLNAIACNATIMVAVGNADGTDAYIVTSGGNGTWTERANPKNVDLHCVCWSEFLGLFVALGKHDGGDYYIITSPDGVNWTEQVGPTGFNAGSRFTGVAWSPKLTLFAACFSTNGAVAISADAINWSFPSTNPFGAGELDGICWDGAYFVVVGSNNVTFGDDATCGRSADGLVWERMIVDPSSVKLPLLATVTSSENLLLASGGMSKDDAGNNDGSPLVYSSHDHGTSWVKRQTIPGANVQLNALCWNGNRYLGVGSIDATQAGILVSLTR